LRDGLLLSWLLLIGFWVCLLTHFSYSTFGDVVTISLFWVMVPVSAATVVGHAIVLQRNGRGSSTNLGRLRWSLLAAIIAFGGSALVWFAALVLSGGTALG
jgi:hypothetical protein